MLSSILLVKRLILFGIFSDLEKLFQLFEKVFREGTYPALFGGVETYK